MALPQVNPLTPLDHKLAFVQPVSGGMRRAFHLWHLASLDAPCVAVVWTVTFARVANVHLSLWVLALIACGVWTVYVGDRLLDARRAIGSGMLESLRERHYFHWRNRFWLLPSACLSAGTAAALIVNFMPSAARHRDSVLAAAALLYFSGVHSSARLPFWVRRFTSKEFLVGLLFTAGCATPTLAHLTGVRWSYLVCFACFTMLAWLNCSAIERWESSRFGTQIFYRSTLVSIFCFASSSALSFANYGIAGLICLAGISALLLLLLDQFRSGISKLTLRAFADLALLTPVIMLALAPQYR